ncbi:MAG: hypothetical protein NTY95_17730 [Bacteroidia bacterium]|nr:hypothetical protein [Bacteroidia bacterium]
MEGGPSKIGSLVDQISYAQRYGYNVNEIILKQMGGLFIIFILSVLSFALMWKEVFREQNKGYLFSLYGPFGMVCVLILILYALNLPFGPTRFLFYLSLLGTIFSAYFLSYMLIKSHNSKTLFVSLSTKLVVIVLLTGLFLLGLLNLYPSPYNMDTSYQTTQSEAVGMRYFYEYRDVAIPVTGLMVAPGTFAWIYLTPEERAVQRLPMYFTTGSKIPWHFGYDTYSSIAFSYKKETNLIIAQKDRVIYTEILPKMAPYRLLDQDFERLNEDSGISLQYSNGDVELWTIKGQNAKVII